MTTTINAPGLAKVAPDELDLFRELTNERARVSGEEIADHVAGELARFKVPREVIFVDALPRNALGKVQHFLLRQMTGPC